MAFRKTTEQPPPFVAPSRPQKAVEYQQDTSIECEPISSLRVLVARIVWCFGGPILLTIWAFRIAMARDGWVAPSDIGFLLALGIVIAARWYCFSANDRTDTQGNTSTVEQLHQYTRNWAIGGILVWIVANLVGNFVAR